MKRLKRLVALLDGLQRRNRFLGTAYALVRKFGDDQANLYVVSLGWYGFTAIYPLLLVVVTVFGYVGVGSLGTGIVNTLHEFPVIGSQFEAGSSSSLHASLLGLVIGLVGLLYGAQGVTQVALQAMAKVWSLPQTELPGFVPRLLRSLGGLACIGLAFVVGAFVGSFAVAHGQAAFVRVLVIGGLALFNVLLYLLSFRILTPALAASLENLIPGAVMGGLGFTLLTTVGTGLVEHQLRHSSDTYGAFASVIGVVTYLLLLAKLSIYSAELNPVVARRLWPRSLPGTEMTEADATVLGDLAASQKRRSDERIDVDFRSDGAPRSAPAGADSAPSAEASTRTGS